MNRVESKKLIHNGGSKFLANVREIVFGVEDGIVSTLGALIGIAIATGDQFTVVVSGVVIIAVESISMGIGSYLSTRSVREIDEQMIHEERVEVQELLEDEIEELRELYYKEGWPKDLANKMALTASKDEDLMLREMSYRELRIFPEKGSENITAGIVMFFSYILGGFIPLSGYLFFAIPSGIMFSIAFAASGLFVLGCVISKFSKVIWWKVGARILI
ncbi:MAG: VIT1/CCC1 transporter family protein, partial [Candidatus Moranbacteria bacterium]|nr:VIT1/CCC1 transporter family protein [Candidatus Moranbacteria bacterium]